MDETRLQAYQNLVEALLQCPNEEELVEILQAHSELIDAGLVEVMAQEAEAYRERGKEKTAEILSQFARKIDEVLGGSSRSQGRQKETFNFLMQVLQTILDNSNSQVVYPLLAKNLDKLDENLAEVLRQWAGAKLRAVEADRAYGIAIVIGNFSNLIGQLPLGSRANNIEIAIAGCEVVAIVFTQEAHPQQWAKLQYNLGLAYSDRIIGKRWDNLEKAIAFYEAALQVYTREAYPQDWAMTQNNLGNAYVYRIIGDRGQNLEKAIAFYEVALQVYTREAYPQNWALIQNNLGAVYCDRIIGERWQNIENAIAAYEAALQVYTREAYPYEWARTQNNLGAAYLDRIIGERWENLEKSIAFYEAALQVYTREAHPQEWAIAQNNLGNSYRNRIVGERWKNLEKAIAAYEAALQVRTREAYPEKWATTQNNLGNGYCNRIIGEGWQNLEKAIAAYEAALQVYTREAYPYEWAMTQNNLGNAYNNRIIGERWQNLEKAIAAYEAALQVYTREAYPQDWARTQNNLGNAYNNRIIGERWDNLEKAIAAYEASLQVRTRKAYPQNHAETLFNLGLAYQRSAKLSQADAQTQLRLAYTTFARAIDTVESIRAQIVVSGDTAKQKLAEEWNKLYRNMVEVCLELGESDRAIGYAERSKARNLVELLANRDLYPKGDIPQSILDELDRLRRQIDAEQKRLEIQERTRNSYGGTISEERSPQINALQTTILNRDRLNQLRQQLDELIARDITPIDSNFRLTQKVEPISYSEIQSLTSENTAILEWYVTGDKFLTFIITPDPPLTPPSKGGEQQSEPPFFRGAGGIEVWQSSPEDLKALLIWANQYLTAYQTNKTQWRQELADRLENLAKILHLNELLSHIPPTVDRLVLIPHRFLHLFPLHALQGKRQQQKNSTTSQPPSPLRGGGQGGEVLCLIDLFTAGVRYAPSCQLLQQAQTRQRQEFDRLFAVQNPTNDLNYTDIEVAAIRQHFHPSYVLIKNDASKANLEGHIPEPGVAIGDAHCAHFSCHGYFNFENPLLSALLLADCYLEPAPAELDPTRHLRLQNGKALDLGKCLTLADLFALDLGACRLVVLSACETGFSDFTSTSDEYISLLSGLLVAGSPSVVGSLWAVNDLSTALLMMRFYENVKAGLSVAVALNQAQIWLRDSTQADLQQWANLLKLDETLNQQIQQILKWHKPEKKPFQNPFYWAAFCAIGQ